MGNRVCVICGKEVQGTGYLDPWGNIVCGSHKRRIMCNCCFRFIGRYSTYSPVSKNYGYDLMDGRYICGLCQETSVINREQIKKSAAFVLKLLKRAGFDIPHDKATVKLLSKDEMSKKHPNALGLCCSHYVPGEPETTTSDIFILHGLPKIMFEAVLAHELLHFWINYNGVDDPENEEGFCTVGGALVYNYYAAVKGDKFAEYLRSRDNKNPDYHYGVKFLEQKRKLQDMGWKEYVENILKFKKL